MPRCPETCPKVIEQRRLLAAQAAKGGVARSDPQTVTTDTTDHDELESVCEDLSSISTFYGKPEKAPSERSMPVSSATSIRSQTPRGAAIVVGKKSVCEGEHKSYSDFAGSAIILRPSENLSSILQRGRQRAIDRKQKEIDDYYLNRGLNYFENFCTCSLECMVRHIAKDKFIRGTLASLMFFALGVKLCFELDSWTLPRTFI